MESKAPIEAIEKAATLRKNLQEISNTIPAILKRQFNFKGRKSPIVGEIVVETLTNEGDTVADPFLGSGMYMVATSQTKRQFFATELDNYTFDVVSTYFQNVDLQKLQTLFNQVSTLARDEINELYSTSCCGNQNIINKLYFDPETHNYFRPKKHRDIKNGENVQMVFQCPICKKKTKAFTQEDMDKINSLHSIDTSRFPNHTLIENSRINITASSGANKYNTNFTKRNQIALLKLQNAISTLEECHEKHLIQHMLVASLTLARTAQYGSGSEYIYQVMREQAQEMNVWYLFESKYHNYIKFYNQFVVNHLNFYDTKCHLYNMDYKELFKKIIESTGGTDLILTDPPYSDQVPYLERSQLYRDWLRAFVDSEHYVLTPRDLENEIVVTNAPSRSDVKNDSRHLRDIEEMFRVFSEGVRDNGFVVIAVNLGKRKYFDLLTRYIIAARKSGFEYITRIDKSINDPSLRKQAAYTNTLSKEMYLIFVKLEENNQYWFEDDTNMEQAIKEYVYNKIQNADKPPRKAACIIEIEEKLLKRKTSNGSVQQRKISNIIEKNFKLDFKHNVYLDEDKLYVELEDSESLYIKLMDLVPVIIRKMLETKGSFTLEDIYFELSDKLCNGDPSLLNKILTSNTKEHDIENLILSYCIQTDRGFIKKPAPQTPKGTEMIDLRQIDPYELEDLIKILLEREGFENAHTVGGAGDRGIDVVAKKMNIKTQKYEHYIFQVKRWIGNVGSTPIQRLNSVKITDGYDYSACFTTSDFTGPGKKEAELTGVEMCNGDQLIERLNKHFPGQYYISKLN